MSFTVLVLGQLADRPRVSVGDRHVRFEVKITVLSISASACTVINLSLSI